MKSTRKFIAAGLAIATMIGVAGCGGSGEVAQEENPTSIKIWHYEESTTAQGKAWDKAIEIFEKETGVKVEFEKKAFEQIRQNASQILNSDDAPDVWNTTRATPRPACSPAKACSPISTITCPNMAGTRSLPVPWPTPASTMSKA